MRKKYFQDKVAIITGASSGIGRATAIELARHGASLVLAARRKNVLECVAEEIKALGQKVIVIPTDVTEPTQVDNLITTALSEFGQIDIFIANAGRYVRGQVTELKKSDFEQSFEINFYGVLYGVSTVIPYMIDQKQGQIVLVSSLDAKKGLPMDGPYTAAKFAITGFFEVLRQELKGKNIYVCNVFPARIDTPMIEHIKVPSISAKIPAEKVARAIVRGIKKHKVEVIVPGHLVFYSILNSISPRFMDWIVRIFHLEGWEE